MILKPGKCSEDASSYRPISLFPIPSKMLERLILARLMAIIDSKQLIPEHQFGFRRKHCTLDQVHRLVDKIQNSFEIGECTAVFLDVSQAFDKVWHEGLLHKMKLNFPASFHKLLKSYLGNRHFFVKHNEAIAKLYDIHAGVPQDSVLDSILYLLYTADLPIRPGMTISTFADDTVILSAHHNPITASEML